jgi:hypothetical protein
MKRFKLKQAAAAAAVTAAAFLASPAMAAEECILVDFAAAEFSSTTELGAPPAADVAGSFTVSIDRAVSRLWRPAGYPPIKGTEVTIAGHTFADGEIQYLYDAREAGGRLLVFGVPQAGFNGDHDSPLLLRENGFVLVVDGVRSMPAARNFSYRVGGGAEWEARRVSAQLLPCPPAKPAFLSAVITLRQLCDIGTDVVRTPAADLRRRRKTNLPGRIRPGRELSTKMGVGAAQACRAPAR